MIPSSDRFDQSTIASLLEVDPLVAAYRAFFSLFDWSVVDDWLAQRSPFFGSHGHPLSTYVKVALLRIKQGLIFATQLHDFLLKHPLLVIELGFDLHLDPHAPYGFDVAQTLPTRFWLGKKLRLLDNDLLQDLLAALVAALQAEIPGLGETVAFDVKHIFAWVRENNPQISVKGPYNVSHIPQGDPDCRLGVKKSSNQEQPDGSTKTKKVTLFGYGSGVAAATDPVYGDIVLAEYTLPFNEADVTYFRPLFQRTQLAVNQLPASVVSPCLPASMTTNPLPTSVTADAAYDVLVCLRNRGSWSRHRCRSPQQPWSRDRSSRPRWHPALLTRLTHASRLLLPPPQRLPRPTLPLSVALSRQNRADLRP